MSRTSFGFRRSFSTGRKISRDNRKHMTNQHQGVPGREHNELHEKRQRSRHDNSDAEKATRSIFGDVPLTDTERRYLWAAQSGNLPALEILLQEAGTFNLSCRDYLGRTALQLAVLGEHYDCIELLLEKSRLDVIEEGLLHAINTENVKICDMFLSHPVYSDQRSRIQMDFQHGFYEQEESSSSFAPDITPIVLAAQCNNFDIVHMLIQKGFTISTPHNYFCLCTECYNHKNFDRVVHSKSRLNAYRGLASTAYLCLSCDDPIYAAFELSRSLQKLAEREKEHKNEYRKLSDKCKNFAVDLLDQCRTNEEVMSALHGGTDTRDLARIKMAIRYEQKKFISHASCQEHLASMWYSGASWFQHQNFPIKLIMVPFGIIFIPVTAIIYVFLPYSRVGKILKSPFMKFMNYICSYTAFLVLLFLGTQLSSFKSSHLFVGTEGAVNGLIMFYVLGMFWAECKQLWEEGVKGYFSQMWNYMDITMLALYTAGYSTEAVIYTKTKGYANVLLHSEDEPILNPQILSKVLFSVANVMSFARIAYILPANETFGQLQISYGRMLQDVGKFIFIYFTVMIAFICGLTSLYSIARNDNFAGLIETTGTLFWAAFGMGNSKAPEIPNDNFEVNPVGDAVEKSSGDGQIMDKEHLAVIEIVGYILYGVYILGAVVVLINMLIAMMSNTFEDIQKSEDCEWKFARAKLWISFIEQGTTLPIPFNIIPTPKSGLKIIRFLKDCLCCRQKQFNSDWQSCKQYDQKYKAIMHRVVLRYIHKMKFEKKGESLKDEILDTREEVIFQLHSVYGRLAARLELMEKDLFTLAKSGLVSQEGAQNPFHSSLTYSRSVPAHQREGDHFKRFLSDHPRESYLQRRKSCYNERPKRDICDQDHYSKGNRETSSTTSQHESQIVSKRESTTVPPTTNKWDDVHSQADVERKVSDSSLIPATSSLSNYRHRNSQTCGPYHGESDFKTDLINREDNFRENRNKDFYISSTCRSQSVIKESSMEDQGIITGQKETPFSSQMLIGSWQTGSFKHRLESNHPNVESQSGTTYGRPRETTTTFADQSNQTEQFTSSQKKSSSTLKSNLKQAAFHLDRPSTDSRSTQASTQNTTSPHNASFQCIKSDLKTQNFNVSNSADINTNTAEKNSRKNSEYLGQCANELCTISQTQNMSSETLDRRHHSLHNSNSSLYNSGSDKKLNRNTSPVNLANTDSGAPKHVRKLGRVNHIYIPDVMSDFPFDVTMNNNKLEDGNNSTDPVFFISQSRVYRYSMSDLQSTDQVSNSPWHNSGDNNNRSKHKLSNSSTNTQPELYHQMLDDNADNCYSIQLQNLPSQVDSHCEDNRSSSSNVSEQAVINRLVIGSNLLQGKYEEDTQINKRPFPEKQHDDLVPVSQFSGHTSYQRKSPMRKRETLPVFSNKSLRFCQMGHDDRSQYSTASSGIQENESVTSIVGRYQQYKSGDLEMNSTFDDLSNRMSMRIPPMATNLRPFPIPISSDDQTARKLSQVQKHFPDTQHTASSGCTESSNTKTSRLKKTSIVSFVRGRRSNKGKQSDSKHNRSFSLSRWSGGSRNDRMRTLHSQRSKEV